MNAPHLRSRLLATLPTVAVALFAGVAAVAGSYAAAGFTPGFVVAPVEGSLARSMPGAVITFAITVLGDLGQKLSLLTAIGLTVAAVGAFAAAGIVLGRRLSNRAVPVVVTVVGGWGLGLALTGAPALSLGVGLPAGLVVFLATVIPSIDVGGEISEPRRQVLGTGLSVIGIGAVGYVLGRRRTPSPDRSLDDTDRSLDPPPSDTGRDTATPQSDGQPSDDSEEETPTPRSPRQQLLAEAEAKSLGVEGMEPLVSNRFYQVDINAVDPTVDESDWTLSVTGEVENEVTIDYEQLRSMESIDRFETLRCVGEQLNGQKTDTALWTGVPVMPLVEEASPQGGCECVMLRAADGYFEEFPIAALEDAIVAYGMNDEVLPRAHGFPARALVPGHWGEINVKWLTEIEILDREADGYWEQRGWHGTGPVIPVAKIHAVNDLPDGRQEVGGHAYAGTRGVQTVEVSTDGGTTWNEAELSEPIPGIDVWRQWRYTYDPPGGQHEVVARMIDGNGELQPSEQADPFPNGPSGWVSRTVR